MNSGNVFRRATVQAALGLALAASTLLAPSASFAQRQIVGERQLALTVEAQADTASRADGVDTYRVVVVNRGGGTLNRISVNVPIAEGYSLESASFTQDDAWVAQNGAGGATLRLEQMRGIGDEVVATLRFKGPADAATNALTERVSASWSTDKKQLTIRSNLPGVTSFALTTSRPAPGRITFNGGTFATNEPVTFWYTPANGASVPLIVKDGMLMQQPVKDANDDTDRKYGAFLEANEQGLTSATLSTASLPAGAYTFVARGNWSGVTGSAPFIVE